MPLADKSDVGTCCTVLNVIGSH